MMIISKVDTQLNDFDCLNRTMSTNGKVSQIFNDFAFSPNNRHAFYLKQNTFAYSSVIKATIDSVTSNKNENLY